MRIADLDLSVFLSLLALCLVSVVPLYFVQRINATQLSVEPSRIAAITEEMKTRAVDPEKAAVALPIAYKVIESQDKAITALSNAAWWVGVLTFGLAVQLFWVLRKQVAGNRLQDVGPSQPG